MIEKNHKGFSLYLNEDKTKVVDFKVYYADADYRNNQKRIIVSVTQSKLEYLDNGLVIRSFIPLENCNFNIVLENVKRANAKRVDYWSGKVQMQAEMLGNLYKEGRYEDVVNVLFSL